MVQGSIQELAVVEAYQRAVTVDEFSRGFSIIACYAAAYSLGTSVTPAFVIFILRVGTVYRTYRGTLALATTPSIPVLVPLHHTVPGV